MAYIRYFFYIAFNWNMRIALYILRQEIKGEHKYGIQTTGADELKKMEAKGIDISHATIYMPVSYDILEELFGQVDLSSVKHFIDIGCGKGRALCVAAQLGCRKVTGIDFSRELCDEARHNLSSVQQRSPGLQYEVINNDAFYFDIPDDADCIFLFNPFDEVIMKGVVQNIMKSYRRIQRHLTIIYVNPLHRELFLKAGFREVFHCKKLQYLEGVVLIDHRRQTTDDQSVL